MEPKTKIEGSGKSTNLSTIGGQTVNYQYYRENKIMGSKIVFKSSETGCDDIYYADDIYHIRSSTKEAGLDLSSTGQAGGYPYDPGKNSITDINCGLTERLLPDVAIASTLKEATVYVNGKSYTYEYNKRDGFLSGDKTYKNTIEIKEENEEYNQQLKREVYQSDIVYLIKNGDAAMTLKYRIKLKNTSSIAVEIKEVIDYYDNAMEIVSTEQGTLKNNNYTDGKYKSKIIEINKTLNPDDTTEFCIITQVDPNRLGGVLDGSLDIQNVVEINKVKATVNGEPVPALDKDSAVGNCIPSNKSGTLEDDTDWSEGISVVIARDENGKVIERQVEGRIFEDYTEEVFLEGEERIGDGRYIADKDKTIKGMQIKLVEAGTGKIATLYHNINNCPEAEIESGETGKYKFSGFVAGDYTVVYKYGGKEYKVGKVRINGSGIEELTEIEDKKYPVQQYKSTIYQGGNKEGANTNYRNSKHWYTNSRENNYSSAIDNYSTNSGFNNMNHYIKHLDGTKTREEIEQMWNEGSTKQHHTYKTEVKDEQAINAYTAIMEVGVEEESSSVAPNVNSDGEVYKLEINNMNFGIVERPRYKVEVDKKINRIQLTKNDGGMIKDFTPGQPIVPSNIIYMKSTPKRQTLDGKGQKGTIQYQIDTEILQGAKLDVEYGFTVINRSEKEYEGYNYYQFGTDKNQLVAMQVANMFDYVDNELKFDTESGMIVDKHEAQNQKNGNNKWSKLEWEETGVTKYISKDMYDNLTDNISNTCKYNTIVQCKGLAETDILPIKESEETSTNRKTATTNLLLQTNVTATTDKMQYNNILEMVEVTKTWGRELYKEDVKDKDGNQTYGQTLGNFEPDPEKPNDTIKSEVAKEPDIAYTEEIIINPPTGGTDKSVLYIEIAIGVLVSIVIIGGIILYRTREN